MPFSLEMHILQIRSKCFSAINIVKYLAIETEFCPTET